jgi:hypothetical protein
MLLDGTYGESIFLHHTRDAKFYTFGSSFEFSPDAGVRGRAMVGLQRFQPVNPEFKHYTGVTFTAG